MDYKNGKIYSIRSFQTDDVYYGSTTQPLSKRLGVHKSHYKAYLDNKGKYISSFEILKHNDFYIELVENYPCNSKDELHRREGEIIREKKCVNKSIAGRTKQEYLKQYYEDNKEKLKERIKLTASKNFYCECGSILRHGEKARHFRSVKHQTFIQNKV